MKRPLSPCPNGELCMRFVPQKLTFQRGCIPQRGILVIVLWVGLWCLTLLSTIFQLYRGGQFDWCRNPEYSEKINDLPQVTDKLIFLRFMLFNATFNNISLISWRSVFLEYPEKTTDLSQVTNKLYHII
jgi:hypothetical protein